MRDLFSKGLTAIRNGGPGVDFAIVGLGILCAVLAYLWASVPLTRISIMLGVFGAMRLRRRLPVAGNYETEHQVYKPW